MRTSDKIHDLYSLSHPQGAILQIGPNFDTNSEQPQRKHHEAHLAVDVTTPMD